jgi:hypothetical protein
MSLGALGLLLWHVATFGVVRQADEGAAARVYQLLMAMQVPIVAYFAITWLPVRQGRRWSYWRFRSAPPS